MHRNHLRRRLLRVTWSGSRNATTVLGIVSIVLSLAFASVAASGPLSPAPDTCDAAGEDGTTALMRAAFAGADDAVVRLLDDGADPNARCAADGTTAILMVFAPLFAERYASDRQLASLPLPLPGDLGTAEGRRARRRSLYALLSAGADPNRRERDTHPLTLAVMLEATWAVEALMAWGADPDLAPNLARVTRAIGDPEIAALLGIE